MNKLLLLLIVLPIISFSQTKIYGTVTYFYNDYQGNKADVGASIFILKDSGSTVNFKTIDSIIEAERVYVLAETYRVTQNNNDAMLKSSFVGKKRREKLAIKIPDNVQSDLKKYGIETKEGFDSLDSRAVKELFKITFNPNVYKTQADGVGNYSIKIKEPGRYYVLIQSANRKGHSMCSVSGKLFITKIELQPNDEKSVSYNFTLL